MRSIVNSRRPSLSSACPERCERRGAISIFRARSSAARPAFVRRFLGCRARRTARYAPVCVCACVVCECVRRRREAGGAARWVRVGFSSVSARPTQVFESHQKPKCKSANIRYRRHWNTPTGAAETLTGGSSRARARGALFIRTVAFARSRLASRAVSSELLWELRWGAVAPRDVAYTTQRTKLMTAQMRTEQY